MKRAYSKQHERALDIERVIRGVSLAIATLAKLTEQHPYLPGFRLTYVEKTNSLAIEYPYTPIQGLLTQTILPKRKTDPIPGVQEELF